MEERPFRKYIPPGYQILICGEIEGRVGEADFTETMQA